MASEPSKNKKKQKPPGWLIDNIAEASRNARRIYLLYISFLAYCALTVASTSDRQIILNDTARLPLLNIDVSLIGFFIIAPLTAIFLFIYLQLYLARIKGLITDLRTNYVPIKKRRLYPWMLNIAEDPEPGSIGKLQRGVAKFSLWWLLPIILILFAFWFVKKHDPILSYVVGAFPALGTFIALYFWCHYENIQYKFKFKMKQVLGLILDQRSKIILASIVLMFEVFLLFFVIPWAMEGGKDNFLKPWICVDLSYQVLTAKPEEEYKTIYWLNLRRAHLEGADLTSTILKKADLRSAHFQWAVMVYVNLEGANLEEANLQGANLFYANLQGANLEEANLQGANLFYANLQGANLTSANLQGADLLGANFQEVDLREANLQGANLTSANLQGADLWGAYLWRTNLQGANLEEANLPGAYLQNANLWEADLFRADLGGADLRNICLIEFAIRVLEGDEFLDLATELLSKAKTLCWAKMNSDLEGRLKKDYPHLFEFPKD